MRRVTSVVGALAVCAAYRRAACAAGRSRAAFLLAARTACAVLWPLTASVVRPSRCAAHFNLTCAWMTLVWWLDTRRLRPDDDDDDEAPRFYVDPTLCTSLAMGLCNLSKARSDPRASQILLQCLVANLLVSHPKLRLERDDPARLAVLEVQRAVLLHSVGCVVLCLCA